jgi:hypothetical protein
MSRRSIFIILLAGMIGILTGCFDYPISREAIGPKAQHDYEEDYRNYLLYNAAKPDVEKQAKEMSAPADKALVYFYQYDQYKRKKDSIYRLYVDNRCVAGAIWPPGFYVWLLSPGVHTFESRGFYELLGSKLTLSTIGGKTYYIEQQSGLFLFHSDMKLTDEEEGRRRVNESHLFLANANEACGSADIGSITDIGPKNVIVSEDRALIYLYRNGAAYDYYDAAVSLDKKPPVELAAGYHLLWQLTPGRHTIESNGGEITLLAHAGETYYVRLDIEHTWWGSWHYRFHLVVNKEEGQRGVGDSVMIKGSPE